MKKIEVSNTAIEDAPITSGSQGSFAEQFTPEDREYLRNLSMKLEQDPEDTEVIALSEEMQAELSDVEYEQLQEDMPKIQEAIDKAQVEYNSRLKEYLEAHPEVDVSEVTPADILTPEELEVAARENELLKEQGTDWGMVWKGVKVAGGVAVAVGLGYLIFEGLSLLGYGPAMGRLLNKTLALASKGLDFMVEGVKSIGRGVAAVVENVKSWKIWTDLGNWLSGSTAEELGELGKGLDMGDLPESMPDPGGAVDPGFSGLPFDS